MTSPEALLRVLTNPEADAMGAAGRQGLPVKMAGVASLR